MSVEDAMGGGGEAATTGATTPHDPALATIASDQNPSRDPWPAGAESAEQQTAAEFDLLVVGGGSGGFAAAIAAGEQGLRVGLVNSGPLGGTCTNRGCIPSKALIRAAEVWWRAGRHPYAGVETAQAGVGLAGGAGPEGPADRRTAP